MASITITVPDALVPRLTAAARDSFTEHSALTDAQLFRRATADYWSQILASYESRLASRTAVAQAAADAQAMG